jgi:hypothetical protein
MKRTTNGEYVKTWAGKAETSVDGVTKENQMNCQPRYLNSRSKFEPLCIVTAASDRPLRGVRVSVLRVQCT